MIESVDVAKVASDPAHISSKAVIDSAAVVASSCSIGPGVFIGSGVILEGDVKVGPNAVLGASLPAMENSRLLIGSGVHIGANATIFYGAHLGAHSRVMPGSVVKWQVPPTAIVEGNPAAIVGYANAALNCLSAYSSSQSSRVYGVMDTEVRGVRIHQFPVIPDLRGNLTVGEFVNQIPFVPKRYFMVFDVPSREVRGEHAHRVCHQFLICIKGSCSVVVDDGSNRAEVKLEDSHSGLYIPPMVWGIQYKYTSDAVLLVFASHFYDPADYIRDYDDFLAAIN